MGRTYNEISEIVCNLGYELLEEYNEESNKHRRVIIKDETGYKYNATLSRLISGDIPKIISINNPFTLENISLWLSLNNKELILCDGNAYTHSSEKLKIYHLKCKEYFYMNWANLSSGEGCAVCSGRQIGERNSLAYLRTDLEKEWDYTKNSFSPYSISIASHKKAWWICPEGHSYYSSIAGRTNMNSGCPTCSDSLRESKVATLLKEYFIENYNAISEYKVFKNPETGSWLPYDIYIPVGDNPTVNGCYVEIHGKQHYSHFPYYHKTKEDFEYCKHKDTMKKKFAKQNGQYIEIDLRKIKTSEQAISYIEGILNG